MSPQRTRLEWPSPTPGFGRGWGLGFFDCISGGAAVSRLSKRALGLGLAMTLASGSPLVWSAEGEGPAGLETAAAQEPAVQEAAPSADSSAAPETPEQARRRELTAAHGAEVADAILAGTVIKEMTMDQVLEALGAPIRKEVIPPDAELWYYPNGEVAFSGGKVSYVSLTAVIQTPPTAPKDEARQLDQQRGTHGEHGGVELPVQVDAPPIQVGDSYVYESRDPTDPASGVSTRRTVTSTKGKVTLSSLNLDNKRAKPRSLVFDRQWNLISTRSPDKSGKDYAPPLKYYDFPLFPGKTWGQTTTETNIKTGATRIHTISGTVGGWERVSVPAGTFRAIKVQLVTELFDPSTGERIPGTDTSWYVPEVRRSVRSDTSGKGGRRGLIQLLHYELK